jgi:hypothetical protein
MPPVTARTAPPPDGEIDPQQALAEIDEVIPNPEDDDADGEPEIVERRKTILVHYRAADGTVIKGACIYEVPDVGGKLRMDVLRARYRGGASMLDPDGEALIEMLAYLEVSFGDRRPPELRNLLRLPDPALLGALYAEAKQHEARFRVGGRDLRASPAPRPES